MNKAVGLISLVFLLIGLYLVLVNGSQTVKIIDAMAKNSVNGIVALQGRTV